MDLQTAARGYLEAEGFDVDSRDSDLIVGRRAGLGSEERMYVWVPSEEALSNIQRRLRGFVGRFGDIADQDPRAAKYFLLPSTAGLTGDFRKTANYLGVKVLVPAQFFDTEMRWERSGRQTAAATQALLTRGREALDARVPQPFTYEYGSVAGDDLLPHLTEALRGDSSKPIHMVVGPAGMGKSFLFEALFARIYEDFIDAKRQLKLQRRPFPLLPDHLRGASRSTANVSSILADFLETDFARPLTRQSFEWRLLNGSAMWLIDGLDEVIARDEDFFTTLFELETVSASNGPKVLICVRDSLLATNPALRDFCSYHGDAMELYRLTEWDRDSVSTFAAKSLPSDEAHRFTEVVTEDPSLAELTRVPFYLSVLLEEHRDGSLEQGSTKQDLLGRALDRLIEREYEKDLLDKSVARPADVMELLETLAGENYDAGLGGLDVSSVRYGAEIILQESSPEEVDRFVENLVQFALFVRAGEGRIRFLQEVLEQYLLGRHLARAIDKDLFAQRLNTTRAIPQEWVTWPVVADAVMEANAQGSILPMAHQIRYKQSYGNLLRLCAVLGPEEVPIRDLPLEGADLSGVSFRDVDFSGVSFRGAVLSGTEFAGCILEDADFKGAVLDLTVFSEGTEERMTGAEFGDLDRFEGIDVNGEAMTDQRVATEWIQSVTQRELGSSPPCGEAQQLRALFGKYVDAHGHARRAKLPERALLRGTRHIDPAPVMKAAISHGYLVPEGQRDQISRPEGDRYSELVQFRTRLTISPGIRRLLDDIHDPDCPHVYS